MTKSSHPYSASWYHMHTRVERSKFYVGVEICPAWHKSNPDGWENFRRWVEAQPRFTEPGMVIDRIDPRGDYEPDNCQLLTAVENSMKMHADLIASGRYPEFTTMISEGMKAYWSNVSEDEYAKRCATASAALTPDIRRSIGEKVSAHWASLSDDERRARTAAQHAWRDSMTEDQIAEQSQRASDRAKEFHSEKDHGEWVEAISDGVATWHANRPPADRSATVAKGHATRRQVLLDRLSQMSEEELEAECATVSRSTARRRRMDWHAARAATRSDA